MHGILDNFEVRYVGDPVSNASSTDANSDRIDMQGYESVAFVAGITDSAATGVATLKIEESDADSDDNMTAVTGATTSVTCADNDDINSTALKVELRKPDKRYVQAVRVSATANIAFGDVIAILKPLRRPAEDGDTISGSAYVSN